MGALIAFFVLVVIGTLFILIVFAAVEPSTAQQQSTAIRREVESEKRRAKAKIDAVTEAHKQQVFRLVAEANRQMVEEQARQARQRAEEVVSQAAQAAKEK